MTTDRLLSDQPEAAASAVRAIVKTQRALRADRNLATEVGRSLFPREEASLIASQVAHDARYYKPQVTKDMIRRTTEFARNLGLLSNSISYEEIVALQFSNLWR